MSRTAITLTVDDSVLAQLRNTMDDHAIAQRIQVELDGIMQRLAAGRAWRFHEVASAVPDLRLFLDDARDLWVAWVDVCKIADVRNPYLEGSTLPRERAPSGSKVVTVVPAVDVVRWLCARKARTELATPLAHAIHAAALNHKQP